MPVRQEADPAIDSVLVDMRRRVLGRSRRPASRDAGAVAHVSTAAPSVPTWQREGGLGALSRRLAMERGDHPPPPGTTREERRVTIPLKGRSINETALRSRSFDALKRELQGLLMREFHRLHYLLPRPIPSVDETGRLGVLGEPTGPVWMHARMAFRTRGERDVENFRTLVAKAALDAAVGPKWKWVGEGKARRFVPANRELRFRDRVYKGGWLDRDTEQHVIFSMDLAVHVGEPELTVWIVWDQPADV